MLEGALPTGKVIEKKKLFGYAEVNLLLSVWIR